MKELRRLTIEKLKERRAQLLRLIEHLSRGTGDLESKVKDAGIIDQLQEDLHDIEAEIAFKEKQEESHAQRS